MYPSGSVRADYRRRQSPGRLAVIRRSLEASDPVGLRVFAGNPAEYRDIGLGYPLLETRGTPQVRLRFQKAVPLGPEPELVNKPMPSA